MSQEVIELYRKALREKDFHVFSSFCRVYSDFKNDFITLSPTNWTYAQRHFDKNRTGKDIVLKPRRIGFTTLELARDLFFAFTNPGSTVMIVAQEYSLARKAIQDINNFIQHLKELEEKVGAQGVFVPVIQSSNVKEIVFGNKSKIIGEVAKNQEASADRTGRGIGVTRLHCTEVAFWSYPELTMKSLLIAAKTAKEIVIESTANGATGYFHDFYMKIKAGEAGPIWKAHFFPWHTHREYRSEFDSKEHKERFSMIPKDEYEQILIEKYKISKTQLKWWREQVQESAGGVGSVLQEFPIDEASCFRIKSQTFLDQEDFEYLERSWIVPINKKHFSIGGDEPLFIWEEPQNHLKYILGADTSYGREQDGSCFYVIESQSGRMCARFCSNKINPTNYGKLIVAVAKMYNDCLVGVEIQASGQAVLESIQNENYYKLFKHEHKDYYGWNTSVNMRIEMFNLLQKMIKEKDPEIIDLDMANEFKSLIFKENKIQHLKGSHDDHIMAFMIAQMIRKETPVMTSTGYMSVKSSRIGNLGFSRIGSQAAKQFSLR